jgi:hypothetical protein
LFARATTCRGGLIRHVGDGSTAACTFDDEVEGCAGRELRHQGEPSTCLAEWGSCSYCGIAGKSQ